MIEIQTLSAFKSNSKRAGTVPIWCPALSTHVVPMRSNHEPSSLDDASWTWPASTSSGPNSSIHPPSSVSPYERCPVRLVEDPSGGQ